MFRNVIRKTQKIAKHNNESVKIYILLLIINVCITIGLPIITIHVIDEIVNSESMGALVNLIIVYLVINVLKIAIDAIIDTYSDAREFSYGKKLEENLIEKLLNKKGEFFKYNKTGDMIETITVDTMKVAEFSYTYYKTVIEMANAVALIVILAYMKWDLMLLIVAMLPLVMFFQNIVDKKIEETTELMRESLAEEMTLSEEYVSNASLIASHGIIEKCLRKHKEMIRRLNDRYHKLVLFTNINISAAKLFMIIAIVLTMLYGGYQVFYGAMSIGVLVAFIQYSGSIVDPVLSVVTIRVMASKLMPSLKRIEEIDPMLESDEKHAPQSFHGYDIRLNNVGFTYPEGEEVYKDVNMVFEEGKKHVIFGESGKGKTTLVYLLTGLWDASIGEINIGDVKISEAPIELIREKIALVSQEDLFFNDTIYDNLMTDLDREYTENEVNETLKKVGIYNEVNNLPQKMNTSLGDKGLTFSGGQRQRLAIARALLKDSPIIIFDEATASLDSETEKIILETVENIKDKTVIIISHNETFRRLGDHVYTVEDKKIIKVR